MERTPSYAILASSPSDQPAMRQDHELTRFERRKLEKAKDKLNIYDLGTASNLASVFGPNWIEWVVPMGYPYESSLSSRM